MNIYVSDIVTNQIFLITQKLKPLKYEKQFPITCI